MVRSSGSHTVQYGTPLGRASKAKAARGRLCDVPGCTTVLSIYNDATSCWPHLKDVPRPPLHR